MNDVKTPRPLSPDEVELLKKQRDLALPAARIAAYDDFAKWLFTIITVVGTLGAAFSNTAFKKLNGLGAVLFFLAIAASGVSLALAVILRNVEPGDANWQDLWDMISKGQSALRIKRQLAWVAGICFAAAIALAGISPLASGDQSRDATATGKSLLYTYGKEGVHVTATLPEDAGTIGEVRISALLSNGESVIGVQRVVSDSQGVMRFDVTSAAIPAGSTGVKIGLTCDSKNNRKQDVVISFQQPTDKPTVKDLNSCFE